jgi:hypothetical protein
MKKLLLSLILIAYYISPISSYANPIISEENKPKFTGQNYSGKYFCTGKNLTVGDYDVIVLLKLNPFNSYGKFGVYDFSTETENNMIYLGQAVAYGNKLALTFKLKEAKKAQFSTGIGEFKNIGKRRWSFQNRYYEPDDTGGNYGYEECTMKVATLPPVKSTNKVEKNSNK